MMDMKTMKNIFNILLLGLMVTTVCSCNDEIEYSPGEPSPFAESKVFFSKDNALMKEALYLFGIRSKGINVPFEF